MELARSLILAFILVTQVFCGKVHRKEYQIQESSLQERSFSLANLNTAFSNLVNSTFIFKAILIYWLHVSFQNFFNFLNSSFQLLFQTVGWSITSFLWNISRTGTTGGDPDISGAVNEGLLDRDFAATNLALAAGQVNIEPRLN